jgi:hypothetical protein
MSAPTSPRTPLTNAERQARYRLAQKTRAATAAPPHVQHMADENLELNQKIARLLIERAQQTREIADLKRYHRTEKT